MRAKYIFSSCHPWLLGVLLTLSSLVISFSVARISLFIGPIIILVIIGVLFCVLIFKDYRWGFYGGIFATSVMFYFERLVPVSIPYGVLCESLFLLSFVSLLFNAKETQWKQHLKNPITIGYLLIFLYHLFQVFNPNQVSITGWLFSLRSLHFLFILFVSFAAIGTKEGLRFLVLTWLSIASAAAFYAIYQEIFGMTGFEMYWVTSDSLRYGLYFILGHMRKFSFLSDPAAFGVFMAYSILAIFSLFSSPISWRYKGILFIAMTAMILAMLYSGTRTAYAMVAIGLIFFALISLRKKTTFIFSFSIIMVFLFVMFGPFYNRYVNRLRTAFKPSQDASMEVRDVKRIKWQSYILDHPIGGGLNTTGSPGVKYSAGHELAGGWDPDSGFLKLALEQGWIGFLMLIIFLFFVMYKGIHNYFQLKDPMLQAYNLTFIVPLLGVTIANYTQNAILYKPIYIFVIITFAVVSSIRDLDSQNKKIT